jgi:hypothetical protein
MSLIKLFEQQALSESYCLEEDDEPNKYQIINERIVKDHQEYKHDSDKYCKLEEKMNPIKRKGKNKPLQNRNKRTNKVKKNTKINGLNDKLFAINNYLIDESDDEPIFDDDDCSVRTYLEFYYDPDSRTISFGIWSPTFHL